MIAIDITVRDDVRQFSETIFLKVPQDIPAAFAAVRAATFIGAAIPRARALPLPPGVEIIGEVFTHDGSHSTRDIDRTVTAE